MRAGTVLKHRFKKFNERQRWRNRYCERAVYASLRPSLSTRVVVAVVVVVIVKEWETDFFGILFHVEIFLLNVPQAAYYACTSFVSVVSYNKYFEGVIEMLLLCTKYPEKCKMDSKVKLYSYLIPKYNRNFKYFIWTM